MGQRPGYEYFIARLHIISIVIRPIKPPKRLAFRRPISTSRRLRHEGVRHDLFDGPLIREAAGRLRLHRRRLPYMKYDGAITARDVLLHRRNGISMVGRRAHKQKA